jgi:hypothetical protein
VELDAEDACVLSIDEASVGERMGDLKRCQTYSAFWMPYTEAEAERGNRLETLTDPW